MSCGIPHVADISTSLGHMANNIASATFSVLNAGKVRTPDMGGADTTHAFTAEVIKNLQ